jgi:hypothetical protein
VLSALTGLALLFGGSAALVRAVPQVLDPDYHARLRQLRQGQQGDPDHTLSVVALGSSRTYHAFDAGLVRAGLARDLGRPVSVTNFAIPTQCFLNDLLTWRRLRRDGVRPDLLLIEVMPALFHGDTPKQLSEEQMPAGRLAWSDVAVLEPYRDGTRPGLGREVALADAAALYSRRDSLVRAVAPGLMPVVDDDNQPYVWPVEHPFRPDNMSPGQRARALARAREEYADVLADFRPGRCAMLRELLASCREEGAQAALLMVPEGPAYRSWYAPATRRNIEDWVDQISREYGTAVIDARDWIDDEDEFFDSHHPLPAGAARFSERLGREHLLPLLRQP